VRSVNVVEAFPDGQLLVEIYVVAIGEQLVELVLGLIALALMSWSLFDQGWIPIMMAMSVGQGIGTLSFALFLVIVIIDLRHDEFRHSLPPKPPKPEHD
jgi:hypothetical protein